MKRALDGSRTIAASTGLVVDAKNDKAVSFYSECSGGRLSIGDTRDVESGAVSIRRSRSQVATPIAKTTLPMIAPAIA
jgi:hypothetical protein